MFRKLFVATCLASSLVFSATAVAQEAIEPQNLTTKEEDYQVLDISILAKGSTVQFWKAVEIGAQEAAVAYNVNVEFLGPQTESDVKQQVKLLKSIIDKKPSAICLASLDSSAMTEAIKKVVDNKIPLIGFDSGVPNAPQGAVVATAATDNYTAGVLAATNMYELIKDKLSSGTARIGVIAQEVTSDSIVLRTKGFVDEMTKLCGGANAVSVEGHEMFKKPVANAQVIIEVQVPTNIDLAQSTTLSASILEKADTVAMYGSSELAINSIIDANTQLNKLGLNGVIAVGFDAGAKQLDAIEQGVVAGSITQNPVQIGFQAVRIAVDYVEGKKVQNIDTGAMWYDIDSLSDPQIADCLYR